MGVDAVRVKDAIPLHLPYSVLVYVYLYMEIVVKQELVVSVICFVWFRFVSGLILAVIMG